MTLTELVAELRKLRAKDLSDGWKPDGHGLIRLDERGLPDAHSSFCFSVGVLLCNGYLGGAFQYEYFNDLRPALIGADATHAAIKVVHFLHTKGFKVCGFDLGVDCIERVALALETIEKQVASPGQGDVRKAANQLQEAAVASNPPPKTPPLRGKAKTIAEYIQKWPGKLGDVIAADCGVTPSHFRRIFSQKLRLYGFQNAGDGEGYFPPDDKSA
jgi:hypothetical protein